MFTLLMTAITRGHKEETLRLIRLYPIESLVELSKDVDNKGHNLIHYLARYNHVEALKFLRDKMPLEMFTQEVNQQSPLIVALKGNAREIVDYLQAENIGQLTKHQREAFYHREISSDCDRRDIISPWSPLFCAASAGNLLGLEELMPFLYADEVLRSDRQLLINFLTTLLDVVIENKHINLLDFIRQNLHRIPLEIRIQWLEKNFITLLSTGSNSTAIEFIENNYADPVKVINLLFPYDDWVVKKRLMEIATQKACLKILKGMLAELNVEDEVKKVILRDIFNLALEVNAATQITAQFFFNGIDVLDVVAIACADDFNKNTELLAILLQRCVIRDDVYVVDAFLKRMSGEARRKLFEYKFPNGWTLMHFAVDHCAEEIVVMLNQFGASYDLQSDSKVYSNLSARQLAQMMADRFKEERLEKIQALESREGKINAIEKGVLKQKELTKLSHTHVGLNKQLRLLDQLTPQELVLKSISGERDHAVMVHQSMYFRMVSKITDGAAVNEKTIDLLINAVTEQRRINGIESEKNCVRGLFKALISVAKYDLGRNARRLHLSLSMEILATAKMNSLFETLIYMTAFEYSLMVQDYDVATKYIERIVVLVKMIAQSEPSLLAGLSLPQVILGKLSLNLCKVLDVVLPDQIKAVLKENSANKSALRFARDKEGFDIQSPVALLNFAVPKALTPADLMQIKDGLKSFEQDIENYRGISVPENVAQSALFRKMALRTYIDIHTVYNWWHSVEKSLCPEAFDIKLEGDLEELKNVHNFLRIKVTIIKLLAEATRKLDKSMDEPRQPLSFVKLLKESEQVDALIDEIGAAIKASEENDGAVLTKPAINPLIYWAIDKRENKTITRLIDSAGIGLLMLPYQGENVVADYLAERLIHAGLVAELKLLISKLPESWLVANKKRLLLTAIAENQPAIIEYLGGDKRAVDLLFSTSLAHPVAPGMLLLRCLRTRQTHLLPMFLSQISLAALENNIPNILAISHGRYDNLLEQLKPIIDFLGAKKFAYAAAKEGYCDLMLDIVKMHASAEDRVEIAIYLLIRIANEYGEPAEYGKLIERNSRYLGTGMVANIVVSQIASRKDSLRVNKNITDNRVISRLVQLVASDIQRNASKLNVVLRHFYDSNHVDGMREMLSSLTPSAAEAAIRYVPKTEGFGHPFSLLHAAINFDQDKFWYLLVAYGADLKAKCHDKTEQTFEGLIEFRHAKAKKPSFSQDMLLAEKQFNDFLALHNKLMAGEKLSQDEIETTITNIKRSKHRVKSLDECLGATWSLVKCYAARNASKFDFNSALSLATSIMRAIGVSGIHQQDYVKAAGLAFALGDYAQAYKHVQDLEKAIPLGGMPDQTVIAQLILTKLTLMFMISMKITMPENIARFYLEKWDELCVNQVIGEGFLPFIIGSNFLVSPTNLQDLLTMLMAHKLPELKKNGVIYKDSVINTTISINELLKSSYSIYALLLNIESALMEGTGKGKITIELLELFYKSANHINAMLRKTWDVLEVSRHAISVNHDDEHVITYPEEFIKFSEHVAKMVNEFSSMLAAEEKKEKSTKTPVSIKKQDKPKKANSDTTASTKPKLSNMAGWGVRITPEQLLSILPPLTYTEIPESEEKKEVKQESVKRAKIPADKQALSAKPSHPKPKKASKPKVIIDVNDFPALPSLQHAEQKEEKVSEAAVTTTHQTVDKRLETPPVINAPISTAPVLEPVVEADLKPLAAPFNLIPTAIVEILRFFAAQDANEFNAYLTGGAVRDLLMGRQLHHDYDIVVDCEPALLDQILKRKFGVDKVEKRGLGKKNSWSVDYLGLKIDFCSKQDAKPDFTCNAIKWHPDIRRLQADGTYADAPGNLVEDPYCGVKDIELKTLRFVDTGGENFAQNKMLIFRMLRFERDFGFTPAPSVTRNIARHKDEIEQIPYKVEDVSKLSEQYQKMLKAFQTAEALHDKLQQYGLFKGMHARVKECKAQVQAGVQNKK